MKAYTRRRLMASAKLGLAAVPFAVGLRLAHGLDLTPGTFLFGFGAGLIVGVAELFLLREWFRRTPFLVHLMLKSAAILLLMFVIFAVLNLLDVLIEGITWEAYLQALYTRETTVALIEGLGVIAFLLFFVQLDRLLGPGLLVGYLTGRYHRPRREARVFMFLDLRNSTSLAEQMEGERYFSFLHDYFAEMSEAILETNADIYQYIGDEVVLSWPEGLAVQEASCVRVFFLIEQRIDARAEHFLKRYGAVPEFKAGVHGGPVVTAQIGEIKREIVYNGDVLNTAARIQGLCNSLGHDLLVSEEIMSKLSLGPEYVVDPLGPVPLKGKGEAVRLSAVRLAEHDSGRDPASRRSGRIGQELVE